MIYSSIHKTKTLTEQQLRHIEFLKRTYAVTPAIRDKKVEDYKKACYN